MKKYIPLVGIVSVAACLGGCAQLSSIEAKVGSVATADLPGVCAALQTADASFQTFALTRVSVGKPLAPSVIVNESAAVAGVGAICADPTTAVSSFPHALSIALSAYSAVVKALASAKAAAGA